MRNKHKPHAPMLTMKLEVAGEAMQVEYEPGDILQDIGLRSWFKDELITKCEVYKDGQRVFGVPILTWERFQQEIKERLDKWK